MIHLIAILFSISSANYSIGEKYTETHSTTRRFSNLSDTVLFKVGEDEYGCNDFRCECSSISDDAISLSFEVPQNRNLKGKFDVFIGDKMKLSRIVPSLPRRLYSRIPTVSKAFGGSGEVEWDQSSGSINSEITFADTIGMDELKIVSDNDPGVTYSPTLVPGLQNKVNIRISIAPQVLPGTKLVSVINPLDTIRNIAYDLIGKAKITIDPPAAPLSVRTGEFAILTLPATNASSIKSIGFGKAPQIGSRITIRNRDEKSIQLDIYADNPKLNDSSLTAYNYNGKSFDLGKASKYFNIVSRTNFPRFVPQNAFVGHIVDSFAIDLKESSSLSENQEYSISSPAGVKYVARYNNLTRSLHLLQPAIADEKMAGEWVLATNNSEWRGYVNIVNIPKIIKFEWENKDLDVQTVPGSNLYSLPRAQTIEASIALSNSSREKFDSTSFVFFDRKAHLVRVYDDGALSTTAAAKYLKAIFQFEKDLPVGPLSIIHKLSNTELFVARVKKFSKPNRDSQNIVMLNVNNKSYQLFPKPGNRINISDDPNDRITINLNQKISKISEQHFVVDLTLYNDKREVVGTKSGFLDDNQTSVDVKFPTIKKIGKWYSLDVRIRQDLNSYSPPRGSDRQSESDEANTEVMFIGNPYLSAFLDITTPLQQSVYIYARDSIRPSIFNLGINVLFKHRMALEEQTRFFPLYFGASAYFSEIDNLVQSQKGSVGMAALVGVNLGILEFAVGGGTAATYYFGNQAEHKKGWDGNLALIAQLRASK